MDNINIVFLGPTGSGKSTCVSILLKYFGYNGDYPVISDSSDSVTTISNVYEIKYKNKIIKLFDAPGLDDTGDENGKSRDDIFKDNIYNTCQMKCKEGIHKVYLMNDSPRLKTSVIDSMRIFTEMLGAEYNPNITNIFTYFYNKCNKKTFEDQNWKNKIISTLKKNFEHINFKVLLMPFDVNDENKNILIEDILSINTNNFIQTRHMKRYEELEIKINQIKRINEEQNVYLNKILQNTINKSREIIFNYIFRFYNEVINKFSQPISSGKRCFFKELYDHCSEIGKEDKNYNNGYIIFKSNSTRECLNYVNDFTFNFIKKEYEKFLNENNVSLILNELDEELNKNSNKNYYNNGSVFDPFDINNYDPIYIILEGRYIFKIGPKKLTLSVFEDIIRNNYLKIVEQIGEGFKLKINNIIASYNNIELPISKNMIEKINVPKGKTKFNDKMKNILDEDNETLDNVIKTTLNIGKVASKVAKYL